MPQKAADNGSLFSPKSWGPDPESWEGDGLSTQDNDEITPYQSYLFFFFPSFLEPKKSDTPIIPYLVIPDHTTSLDSS